MSLNPVVSLLGRRLRLAVIGGGPGSFIGAMHRQAAALDNRYELVAAALSSNPEKSLRAGRELGLAADRVYASGLALIEGEKGKDGGADVVAIMTPNDSHFELASAALAAQGRVTRAPNCKSDWRRLIESEAERDMEHPLVKCWQPCI